MSMFCFQYAFLLAGSLSACALPNRLIAPIRSDSYWLYNYFLSKHVEYTSKKGIVIVVLYIINSAFYAFLYTEYVYRSRDTCNF